MNRMGSSVGGLLALLVALAPGSGFAGMGDGPAGWLEPVLSGVRVQVQTKDHRKHRLDLERARIDVPWDGSVILEIQGEDQWGREFPRDRSAFGLEVDRRGRDLVRVHDIGHGRFRISARENKGECRLVLWVANNMNLEWKIKVRVQGPDADGYDRKEAEFIADRLYRGLLGRSPDPAGFRAAVAEIQRGRLDSQVRGMLASREFQVTRHRLSDADLLEQLYRGLLDRKPDSAGARDYLPKIRRHQERDVILRILRSDEFLRQLAHETGQRGRHR
jgi:hypothetical protein